MKGWVKGAISRKFQYKRKNHNRPKQTVHTFATFNIQTRKFCIRGTCSVLVVSGKLPALNLINFL